MRQKAKKETAEADIRKAIDVWDCGRSWSGGVILDWRTWKRRRWGVCGEEDNVNVNGQVKALSDFFERAGFGASGWLLGSPGVLLTETEFFHMRQGTASCS